MKKRKVLSAVLSLAMVLSLGTPAMAEPAEAGTETGIVIVENVNSGAIIARVNWEEDGVWHDAVLPIGEAVELPANTNVRLGVSEPTFYDDGTSINSKCREIAIATASNGKKTGIWPDNGSSSATGFFRVEAGVTTTVTATFEEVKPSQGGSSGSGSSSPKDEIFLSGFEKNFPIVSDSAEGSNSFFNLIYRTYTSDGKVDKVTHLSGSDVDVEIKKVELSGQDVKEKYKFSYSPEKEGITWEGPLEKGRYGVYLSFKYNGETYDFSRSFAVGCSVSLDLPLAKYIRQSYELVSAGYGPGSMFFDAGDTTVGEAIEQLQASYKSKYTNSEFTEMYGYTLSGWKTFDRNTGEFSSVDLDKKLSEFCNENASWIDFEAFFEKDGKEYTPLKLARAGEPIEKPDEPTPGEPDTPDTPDTPEIPQTNAELQKAVDKLDELVPQDPSKATADQKKAFDDAVDKIVSGIDSMNGKAAPSTIKALGEVLAKAFDITVEPSNSADASILVAAGLTSYEEVESLGAISGTVELVLDNVATASNALATFDAVIEIRDANKQPVKEVDELQTDITVTVTLPDTVIASMSNAYRQGRTCVIVIESAKRRAGSSEIELSEDDIDTANKTVTFRTANLGKFTIIERKSSVTPSPAPGTHYGGGSSSSSSASSNRNASGNWVQSADGRWWFQYTGGGYPAGKWEMIKDKWYYFNADGYMATGWQQLGNVWYHLDDVNGDMTTGWYQDAMDGKWYYFDANGAMQTGWQQIGGVYYYLTEVAAPSYTYDEAAQKWVYMGHGIRPYGSMYANEVTPDGYTVDASGAWVQ